MTLILPRTELAKDFVTGGQDNVGIRVPAHSVALALLKEFESQGGYGVVAPSANRFGKVSPTCAEDVNEELANYLSGNDLVLDGGQSVFGVESTIINCTQSSPVVLRPGAITVNMIRDILGVPIEILSKITNNQIKASGLLENHYAPIAKLYLSGTPQPGDGFIALDKFPTPNLAIRLANPVDNEEYARVLYKSLRLADNRRISKVFVVPPDGDDIAVAIRDRLSRAANSNQGLKK